MDFSEALKLLKNGEFIYRYDWIETNKTTNYERLYLGINNNHIYESIIVENKRLESPYFPTHEDILADDWKVL